MHIFHTRRAASVVAVLSRQYAEHVFNAQGGLFLPTLSAYIYKPASMNLSDVAQKTKSLLINGSVLMND
jgi:hypothetical protein